MSQILEPLKLVSLKNQKYWLVHQSVDSPTLIILIESIGSMPTRPGKRAMYQRSAAPCAAICHFENVGLGFTFNSPNRKIKSLPHYQDTEYILRFREINKDATRYLLI